MPKLIIIVGCNGAGKSTFILQIENGLIVLMTEHIPEYFNHRLLDITKYINTT